MPKLIVLTVILFFSVYIHAQESVSPATTEKSAATVGSSDKKTRRRDRPR
jgi:hypothetical protein